MKIKVFGEGSVGEFYFAERSQGRDFLLLAQMFFFITKARRQRFKKRRLVRRKGLPVNYKYFLCASQ
jgi:hypothetical protein